MSIFWQEYIQTLESLPKAKLLELFQRRNLRSVLVNISLLSTDLSEKEVFAPPKPFYFNYFPDRSWIDGFATIWRNQCGLLLCQLYLRSSRWSENSKFELVHCSKTRNWCSNALRLWYFRIFSVCWNHNLCHPSGF